MSLGAKGLIWAAPLLLSMLGGCSQPAPPAAQTAAPPPPAASATWPGVAQRFIDEYLKAQPYFAAQSGRHEYDGQMPDFSAAGIKAEVARLHGARQYVSAVEPGTLQPNQQLEREVMLNVVDRDLFALEKAQQPFKNPAWYLGNIDPDMYLSRDYAPLDQRMKAYIAYARTIPGIAQAIQSNLRTPLPKTFVDYGSKAFAGFADFYRKDVAAVFADVKDADLQKQLAEVNAAASKSMSGLKVWFDAQRAGANDGFAYGPDLFAQMVKDTEQVDLPLDQIEAAGKADLERNTAMLAKECATYLPKGTLRACVEKMSANKPKGTVIDAARAQLVDLKAFIEKNHVVSIPSQEEAKVAVAPPYNSANFAFINIPGPYDHGVASTYNIAPPDPKWTKAEQSAYIPGIATLKNTSAHEVWPGHFLQFLHANANPSKVEALWVGYAYAEGWAHYCEEMMIDMGLGGGDPELHIGQLRDALLRDVRLLSAIGLHTQGMTVAQSNAMFIEKAFQDPGNARQQSARGTYDPGYLNYTMGKLMIRKLRSDWIAKKALPAGSDEKTLWHDFHDQFLSYGGPPIPLVRKQMVGEGGTLL